MIVLDTSAAVDALVVDPPNPALVARLAGDGDLHAPHLLDVKFVHALRGLVAGALIAPGRAAAALDDLAALAVTRYPHGALVGRMWTLRHDLTAYDAAFVALAEALDAPLVTLDTRLADAPGHGARAEVFTRSR